MQQAELVTFDIGQHGKAVVLRKDPGSQLDQPAQFRYGVIGS